MNDITHCLAAYCPPIGLLVFLSLYTLLNPWKRKDRGHARRTVVRRRF